jgi:hypothetical protein
MKYTPEDNILSGKAKKNKKDADLKPYFDNTHQVFTPSWVKYKNPSLKSEEEEGDEDEKPAPKGKALLKRVYGGGSPCWKGFEQFGMKEKNGKKVPNCVPVGSKSIKRKGGCGIIPCKTRCKKIVGDRLNQVVDNYQDIVNHLEEHQAEGVGDPKDAKQARVLKKDIKRINSLHLLEADKIGTGDPLYQVSNPRDVQREARDVYGKDAIVYKSSNPKKKYQIQDKKTGKWVHFGDAKMEDFTKHQDPVRRERYLKRALGIKGKWRQNPYSPNTLSILLLW